MEYKIFDRTDKVFVEMMRSDGSLEFLYLGVKLYATAVAESIIGFIDPRNNLKIRDRLVLLAAVSPEIAIAGIATDTLLKYLNPWR